MEQNTPAEVVWQAQPTQQGGTMNFNTYGNEKQKQAFKILFDSVHTDIGYGGAAWGWKTYLGVSWQWIMRQKYPGTTWFFWRKELKRLKTTTLASYFKFCEDYKIPQAQRGNYNAQDSILTFPNGSKILLLDLAHQPSDPLYTRFGSLELTDGFIDESNEIDEQCITIISTRIGRQRNDEYNILPKLLQTFNPDKGYVYRKFYKASLDWNIEPYRVFIPALATDNKKLPKSYIDQLMKADEVTKQRLLFGNFDYDDTPGRLFDYEALNDIFTNPKHNGEKFISVDVAREGKDTTVICVWDGFEIVEIITEGKSRMDTLAQKVRNIAHKYNIGSSRIIADENGVGGGLIDNLRCQWFINNWRPIEPKNPNLSQKRNFENIKTQCYYALSKIVNDRMLRINCPTTIQNKIIEELDVIVQVDIDKDGKYKIIRKDQVKEKIGRSPDYSDAIMMRMFYDLKRFTIVEEVKEVLKDYDPILDDDEDEYFTDWREKIILDPY